MEMEQHQAEVVMNKKHVILDKATLLGIKQFKDVLLINVYKKCESKLRKA
jgi:hypothetical protein